MIQESVFLVAAVFVATRLICSLYSCLASSIVSTLFTQPPPLLLKIWIVTLGLEMPAIWNALNLWEHKVLWLILIPSKLHKKLSLYCNCFCKIWNFINILALLNTSNSAHCVIRFRWNIHLIRERSLGGRKVSKQRLECSSKVGSGQSHKNTKNSDNNSK